MRKIKVLIADASSYVRLVMSDILSAGQDIVVVETAQDGEDMLNKARIHQPDVIILDVEIPKNSRFSILNRIQKQSPAAVVLIGKEDKIKTAMLLDTIKKTACHILVKPDGLLMPQMRSIAEELVQKVKLAAKDKMPVATTTSNGSAVAEKENIPENVKNTGKARKILSGKAPTHLIVLGGSTGGAPAIENILKRLPANFPAAILIAQHMPPGFSATFARRLNSICALTVEEAQPGCRIESSKVIIATGEANMLVQTLMGSKTNLCIEFSYEEYSLYDCPSVDLLMQSAAAVYEDKTVGIVLSGMGKDGSLGLKSIQQNGGLTIAQDQKSSTIFGMAKAAIEEGVVDKVLPLSEIPRYLIRHITHS